MDELTAITRARLTRYAVPAASAGAFEGAFREALPPHALEACPDPLASGAVLLSPAVFAAAGVPVSRCCQRPGEFVVVFARAHTASLCSGFSLSESCNVAPPDWLRFAEAAVERSRALARPPRLCLEARPLRPSLPLPLAPLSSPLPSLPPWRACLPKAPADSPLSHPPPPPTAATRRSSSCARARGR